MKVIAYVPAARLPIVCEKEPVCCRIATCEPSGAAELPEVNPLLLPEIPDKPVNVQALPLGVYANPEPPRALIDVYGVRAQMLGPVEDSGTLAGWLSAHSTTERDWTADDLRALDVARAEAARVMSFEQSS